MLLFTFGFFNSLDGRSTAGCSQAYQAYQAYRGYSSSLCQAEVSARTVGGLFQTPNMFIPGLADILLDGDWVSEGINDTNTATSGLGCSDRSACASLGLAHEHAKCSISEEEIVN